MSVGSSALTCWSGIRYRSSPYSRYPRSPDSASLASEASLVTLEERSCARESRRSVCSVCRSRIKKTRLTISGTQNRSARRRRVLDCAGRFIPPLCFYYRTRQLFGRSRDARPSLVWTASLADMFQMLAGKDTRAAARSEGAAGGAGHQIPRFCFHGNAMQAAEQHPFEVVVRETIGKRVLRAGDLGKSLGHVSSGQPIGGLEAVL